MSERVCAVCRKPLIRKETECISNFKKRKTCGKYSKCYPIHHANQKKNPYKPPVYKLKEEDDLLTYEDPRDAEQARINLEIHRRDSERRGAATGPVHILTKEEIADLYECGEIESNPNILQSAKMFPKKTAFESFEFGREKEKVRKKWAGSKIGLWTVLDESPKRVCNSAGTIYLPCKCECGTHRYIALYSLSRGVSLSCGCRTGIGGKPTAKVV